MSELSAKLDAIHTRLVEGSPTASLELFDAALKPLIGFLRRQFKRMPPEVAYDRAVDALLDHVGNSKLFEPAKSSLWTFLCMAAKRDAQDALKKATRRGLLEKDAEYDIELWGRQTKDAYEAVEIELDAETVMRLHGGSIARTEAERAVLDLMLEGERETGPFAAALGLGPGDDPAAEVKKAKDRINLRIGKVFDEL